MNPRIQLRRHRRLLEGKLKAYERKYAKLILLALNKQTEQAIANNGIFLSLDLTDTLSDLYKEVGVNMASIQYDALKSFKTKASDFFINNWLEFMMNYIFSNIAQRVVKIDDTSRMRIRDTIALGYSLGMEEAQIAKFIRDRVGNINIARSLMIARTEIAEAANIAKDKSAEDWQQETGESIWKVWVHRYAKEPRDWHLSLDNGKAIPKDKTFTVTDNKGFSVEMLRPHDPNGGARNNVNCSCVVVYVSESFAKRVNS